MKNETIAAVATHLSESGISIIRVSGPDAFSIGDKIFKGVDGGKVSSYKTHTIHYGFIYNCEEIVDEVMLSVMKGPKSYTTEDTIEINCHGGLLITQKVLEIVINNGARLALPGEFTKRAFLNGRIDLSKAEAVMDIISSESSISLKSSVSQLRGSVYNNIKDLRDKIIYEIAFIESALDDPEHISLDGYPEKLREVSVELIDKISLLINSFDNGRIIKDGINTVILGKPNAGKSSLLNILSGFDRAIVTDIAGTTRDIIEEKIHLGDVNLNLIDTAGIRNTDDVVEKIGVDKALSYAKDADFIIYVVDSSVPLDDNDNDIINLIKNKKVIVIYNKSDLDPIVSLDDIYNKLPDVSLIKTSITENIGIDDLINKINEMFVFNEIDFSNEVIITNLRQKEALSNALISLKQVVDSIDNCMPEDFYSIDLMSAYSFLGNITGEEVSDDLVNEIFSKFCMGK